MPNPQLNKEEFLGWLQHPVTELLRKIALARRQQLMEEWASGTYMHETAFATALQNARAQGECRALSLLTEGDFDSLMSEVYDDGKQERPAAEG